MKTSGTIFLLIVIVLLALKLWAIAGIVWLLTGFIFVLADNEFNLGHACRQWSWAFAGPIMGFLLSYERSLRGD